MHVAFSAGKDAGIDYTQALNRAIAKDPAGLATLFGFTNTPQHDAAAGPDFVRSFTVVG